MLGTTKRKDGKLQVTYGGHPLYLFLKDTKAGDTKGQGFVHFGGAWWGYASGFVDPDGHMWQVSRAGGDLTR